MRDGTPVHRSCATALARFAARHLLPVRLPPARLFTYPKCPVHMHRARCTHCAGQPPPPLTPVVRLSSCSRRAAKKRLPLDANTLPSAALVTWLDPPDGAVTAVTLSNDVSIVAAGFADGVVRSRPTLCRE